MAQYLNYRQVRPVDHRWFTLGVKRGGLHGHIWHSRVTLLPVGTYVLLITGGSLWGQPRIPLVTHGTVPYYRYDLYITSDSLWGPPYGHSAYHRWFTIGSTYVRLQKIHPVVHCPGRQADPRGMAGGQAAQLRGQAARARIVVAGEGDGQSQLHRLWLLLLDVEEQPEFLRLHLHAPLYGQDIN